MYKENAHTPTRRKSSKSTVSAFKNVTSGCILNTFNPVQNELSFQFLGMIFGSVGATLTVATHTFIADMVYIFNMGIVCFSCVIVTYSTFLSTLSSAQDGSVLGAGSKGMSNAWVMLRTVIGISLQVPAFSGYSAVQVFIMYVTVQGVNMASSVWGTYVVAQAEGLTVMVLPSDNTLQSTQQILTGDLSYRPASPLNPNSSPSAQSFRDPYRHGLSL